MFHFTVFSNCTQGADSGWHCSGMSRCPPLPSRSSWAVVAVCTLVFVPSPPPPFPLPLSFSIGAFLSICPLPPSQSRICPASTGCASLRSGAISATMPSLSARGTPLSGTASRRPSSRRALQQPHQRASQTRARTTRTFKSASMRASASAQGRE